MTTLQQWLADKPGWVADAMSRAAKSGEATKEDAEALALRVQAANGIAAAGQPECELFDDALLLAADGNEPLALLGSIGPLDNVDRLLPQQQLKFALDGMTVIYGENGSGKSGYARAARRLCTARVPIVLQSDIFVEDGGLPAVTFALKTGDAEPVVHTWTEGSDLPKACRHMSFLDTANAAAYIEDRTEILFLPPEVQVLTILGQLYVLASRICQAEADRLTDRYSGPFEVQFQHATTAGGLVGRLTTTTNTHRLPDEAALREAGKWDAESEEKLNILRLEVAQGPLARAKSLRRLATGVNPIVDILKAVLSPLSREEIEKDGRLVTDLKVAHRAAADFAAGKVGQFPLDATGGESWRSLFLLARRFAAETDTVPEDGEFAEGDLCVLCQRPLDDQSARRMNAFDAYIADATTEAVEAAKRKIQDRLAVLTELKFLDAANVMQSIADHPLTEELLPVIDDVVQLSALLDEYRGKCIDHLNGGSAPGDLPGIKPLEVLVSRAEKLVERADELEAGDGSDVSGSVMLAELVDRKALSECLPLAIARLKGLSSRLSYLACVADLNTAPVSRQASTLRTELVSPNLRKRIEEEIAALGIDHIRLKFTEQSAAGKSFFEMALDSAGVRRKKQNILSEGEQRALAIACFLADPHVHEGHGALIIDDPVTSLDHIRMRRVAKRLGQEAAKGRQVIVFTHNLLFYQELLRACADRNPQVGTVTCLIQQTARGFGLVTVNDRPWIAKKVKARKVALAAQLTAIPDDLPADGEPMRLAAKQFYTDLRETWERAVEEVVLGGVVERFGTDVKTQSLKLVEVTDDDYRTIFFAIKRASERSGHDQAQGKQIDPTSKEQMKADLEELNAFISSHAKKSSDAQERRKELETAPAAGTI